MVARLEIRTARIRGASVATGNVAKTIGGELTATIGRGVRKLKPEVERILKGVYETLERRHGKIYQPPGRGLFPPKHKTLRRRSGEGLQSIRDSIRVRMTGAGGVVGSMNAAKLAIHETGGTTRATGRYMAIPTVYATNSRGMATATPGDFDRSKTFVRVSRRGKLFIFERRRGKQIVPLFLLKKSVKIPARLGLFKALGKVAPQIERAADTIMREARR